MINRMLVNQKIFMNLNHLELFAVAASAAIEPSRIEYLLHQQHLYQAAKPELLGQYQGQLTENLCYSCTAFLDTGSDGLMGEVRL
jgi:hypothetical protein